METLKNYISKINIHKEESHKLEQELKVALLTEILPNSIDERLRDKAIISVIYDILARAFDDYYRRKLEIVHASRHLSSAIEIHPKEYPDLDEILDTYESILSSEKVVNILLRKIKFGGI